MSCDNLKQKQKNADGRGAYIILMAAQGGRQLEVSHGVVARARGGAPVEARLVGVLRWWWGVDGPSECSTSAEPRPETRSAGEDGE